MMGRAILEQTDESRAPALMSTPISTHRTTVLSLQNDPATVAHANLQASGTARECSEVAANALGQRCAPELGRSVMPVRVALISGSITQAGADWH